ANVRYLLSIENGSYKIDENPNVLPRFFFAPRVQTVNGLTQAAKLLHAPDFNPAELAIVEAPTARFGTGTGIVNLISYRASAVSIETHTPTDAFLVTSDAWYPGWEATIDGKSTMLYITDVAFRGIQVPAGDHRIEMRFVPRILYRSAAISGAV